MIDRNQQKQPLVSDTPSAFPNALNKFYARFDTHDYSKFDELCNRLLLCYTGWKWCCLSRVHPNRTSGPDGLPGRVLKVFVDQLRPLFSCCCCCCCCCCLLFLLWVCLGFVCFFSSSWIFILFRVPRECLLLCWSLRKHGVRHLNDFDQWRSRQSLLSAWRDQLITSVADRMERSADHVCGRSHGEISWSRLWPIAWRDQLITSVADRMERSADHVCGRSHGPPTVFACRAKMGEEDETLALSSNLSKKLKTLLQDSSSWHLVITTLHFSWKSCTGFPFQSALNTKLHACASML